jgi:hypothetical protein
MRTLPRRKFTRLDAVLLVAAPVPALLAFLAVCPRGYPSLDFENFFNIISSLRTCLVLISFPVAAWTLAVWLLGLRQPRPPLRRRLRQPGVAACTAALVVLAIRAVNFALVGGMRLVDEPDIRRSFSVAVNVITYYNLDRMALVPSEVGCAVAAVWAFLALRGWWRAESSWIDRLGRFLGLFWLGTVPFGWFIGFY